MAVVMKLKSKLALLRISVCKNDRKIYQQVEKRVCLYFVHAGIVGWQYEALSYKAAFVHSPLAFVGQVHLQRSERLSPMLYSEARRIEILCRVSMRLVGGERDKQLGCMPTIAMKRRC